MNYIQAYYTDIGTRRKLNEDSLALLKAQTDFGEVLLAVVCDGMGGHSSGEVASRYSIQRFAEWFKKDFPPLLYGKLTPQTLNAVWTQLVTDINYRLTAYGEQRKADLGSTLTAFLFCQDQYYVAHVGDSRGYEITADRVRQITQDQSYVASRVEHGLMTAEEARNSHQKNYLLECLGITNHVNMIFSTGKIQPNATYLLCSDGFWHCLADGELERYLSPKAVRTSQAARMHLNFLVEQVKMRGERDNISAIAVIPGANAVE